MVAGGRRSGRRAVDNRKGAATLNKPTNERASERARERESQVSDNVVIVIAILIYAQHTHIHLTHTGTQQPSQLRWRFFFFAKAQYLFTHFAIVVVTLGFGVYELCEKVCTAANLVDHLIRATIKRNLNA